MFEKIYVYENTDLLFAYLPSAPLSLSEEERPDKDDKRAGGLRECIRQILLSATESSVLVLNPSGH